MVANRRKEGVFVCVVCAIAVNVLLWCYPIQVAYHGSPFKAYEVFITALKAQLFEKGLVLPQLEDQNPAGTVPALYTALIQHYNCTCLPYFPIKKYLGAAAVDMHTYLWLITGSSSCSNTCPRTSATCAILCTFVAPFMQMRLLYTVFVHVGCFFM